MMWQKPNVKIKKNTMKHHVWKGTQMSWKITKPQAHLLNQKKACQVSKKALIKAWIKVWVFLLFFWHCCPADSSVFWVWYTYRRNTDENVFSDGEKGRMRISHIREAHRRQSFEDEKTRNLWVQQKHRLKRKWKGKRKGSEESSSNGNS